MLRALLVLLLVLLLAAPASAADRAATQRALASQMRWAGGGSGAFAVDLDSGRTLYSRRADVARVPASVEKLYTTSTALLTLGPARTLDTLALAAAPVDGEGTLDGDLYLKGAGDPTLDVKAIDQLADDILDATGLIEITGHVVGDESAFDQLRGPPSSLYHTSGYVGPLSALIYNRGRTGMRSPYWQARPARWAADALAHALHLRGVIVAAKGREGIAPAGAVAVATHPSPPVQTLIKLANVPSDNFIAETLLKGIAAATGLGTTQRGAAIVRATVRTLGVTPSVVDGSGLSRSDRTSPRQVVQLLTAMAARPEGAILRGSLAVMGRTGTLHDRLRHSAATGRCQAKTGTLISVSSLAGYCLTAGGHTVAFAILMNGVSPWSARILQDRMVSALVRYV